MYLKICIIDEIVRETEELNFYFSADLFCVGRGISEKQNMKTWWCDCLFFLSPMIETIWQCRRGRKLKIKFLF